MTLSKRIGEKIRLFFLNNKIKRYKYIHFMFNDKFNKPFVDFLNKNFDTKEHLILCKRWFNQFPFPEGENVVEVKTFEGLNFYPKSIKKLIFYSLFDEECIDLLYRKKSLLNKSYWQIWGGDVYSVARDKKNDYVRSNFKGYIGKVDELYVRKKYNIDKQFYEAFIESPINFDMLNSIHFVYKSNLTTILINNSCDGSTIEIIKALCPLSKLNINIRTILSYGDLEWKDEIIRFGKESFGCNFSYIDTYLSAKEYLYYCNECDILILNQLRQQGMGNIKIFAYLGKKVYVRKDVSTFSYLAQKGIKLHDTNELKNGITNSFLLNDEIDIIESNRAAVVNNWCGDNIKLNCWMDFFMK